MPSVTVDLADLETIVLTTGALKTIEGALAQRRNDPFVRPHLEFTAAHDRLAVAMRNATRAAAGTLVDWDGELDDDEIKMLRRVGEGTFWLLRKDKAPVDGEAMSIADRLSAKGCVIMGHFVTGILWAENKGPELTIDPKGFPVKITDRGAAKLREIDAKKTDETLKAFQKAGKS